MKKISFISALLLAIVMNVNAAVVYNGEPHNVASWNALRLTPSDYSLLADIAEGDVLVITMTTEATDACVKLQDGSWHEFGGGEEYVRYDVPSGSYAFVLGEAAADSVASEGVCVTGKNYTITKVEIYYHKAKIWDVSVSDNTGWHQSDEIGHNPSIFASLTEGDLLGAEITAINDGETWHQYTIRGREDEDSEWKNLEDIIFVNGINKTGFYATKLSSAQVNSLKTKNIHVGAQYLNLNGIHTYTATKTATAVDNTNADSKAVKLIRDGQVFILRDNKTYTLQGQLIK